MLCVKTLKAAGVRVVWPSHRHTETREAERKVWRPCGRGRDTSLGTGRFPTQVLGWAFPEGGCAGGGAPEGTQHCCPRGRRKAPRDAERRPSSAYFLGQLID